MTYERHPDKPANIVALNRYIRDSELRISADSVRAQEWYITRLRYPGFASINRYAMDVILRVVKTRPLKGGAKMIYALHAEKDGSEEVGEDDATELGADGFLVYKGHEQGYLLDAFRRPSPGLGSLAAEAVIERPLDTVKVLFQGDPRQDDSSLLE